MPDRNQSRPVARATALAPKPATQRLVRGLVWTLGFASAVGLLYALTPSAGAVEAPGAMPPADGSVIAPAPDGTFRFLHEIVFLLIFLMGVGASATFSGLETAVYSMSRVRLLVRQTSGDPRAAELRRETSDTRRLLSTLLICNNAANFVTSFGFTAFMAEVFGHAGEGGGGSVAIDTLVLTPLLFVFGETLPKEISRSHADAFVYPAARVLKFLRIMLTVIGLLPLVALAAAGLERVIDRWTARIGREDNGDDAARGTRPTGPAVGTRGAAEPATPDAGPEVESPSIAKDTTSFEPADQAEPPLDDEGGSGRGPDRAGLIALSRPRVAALLREGIVHGIVSTRQTDLVDRALAMRDVTIADVLLPWAEVIRIPQSATPVDIRQRIATRGGLDFVRYPVVDTATGRVKGVINLIDWLIEDERNAYRRATGASESSTRVRTAGAAAGPALFLPVHMSVREGLDRMRGSGVRMAIVGAPLRPVGIVTYLDLIEPLTGEPTGAAGVLNVVR